MAIAAPTLSGIRKEFSRKSVREQLFFHAGLEKPKRRRTPMVYLQITLKIAPANRPAAAGVYQRYKAPFLNTIAGAKSKELLVRDDDVQVLHGFDTAEQAIAYLKTGLFTSDVVGALKPLLDAAPDVRIYMAA
jgi:hypothetical protein